MKILVLVLACISFSCVTRGDIEEIKMLCRENKPQPQISSKTQDNLLNACMENYLELQKVCNR
jgi:hypothetical protein